ncbi:MAG: phospholipid carrier-dependent glycosyltransferase [Candidatus Limnocylindrus sp.]
MSTSLIIALAVALRMIIAYVLLPADAGFTADLEAFRFWAADLGANGPLGAYERGYFLDYLPGYLWILWPLGALSGALTGSFDPGALIKLPGILADGLLILVTVRLASELGASTRAQRVVALLLAFTPVVWLNSAVWGQVDAVGTSALIVAVTELIKGRTLRGAALAALAAVIKPQFGILIPLIAVIAVVRARRSGDAWSLPLVALTGTAVVSVIALPFGLTVIDVIQRVGTAAATYPYLSVNAWNLWALADSGGTGIILNGGWGSDTVPLFGFGPPALFVGTLLLVAAIAVAGWAARHDERTRTVAALALIAIAFFLLPTRVHERYLFPAVPLTLALAAAHPRWRIVAALTALVLIINTWGVLTLEYLQSPGIPDLGPITDALHSPTAIITAACATTVAFAVAGYQLLQLPTGESRVVRRRAAPVRVIDETNSSSAAPRARLTRVDLWMLAVIAVTALSLRGWRVGEPTRFHFDEVYHVRTATEFMQHWRYGEPHAIYEYTHPHLAKYAIAGGLELFGAPRVDGGSTYGAPILAIASRQEGAQGAPRIWVATAAGIDVISSETRAIIARIDEPGVRALSVAGDGSLWGISARGEVLHAPGDAVEGAENNPLTRWDISVPTIHTVRGAGDVAFVATTSEVLRVERGAVTARADVDGVHAIETVRVDETSHLLVAGSTGLTLLKADDLSGAQRTAVTGGVVAIGVIDWFDEPRVYAAGRDEITAFTLRSDTEASRVASISISGASAIIVNNATRVVHAVAPTRAASGGAALWSIEPNGNAYFADTELRNPESQNPEPLMSSAVVGAVIDGSAELPDGGRGELITAWPNGEMVQVAVGDLSSGWRWPGVIAGAAAAALLALLARLLTERRDVAALTGLLALLDGAGFVQSRIGMNDAFLLAALLAAACAFVAWAQGRARGAAGGSLLLLAAGSALGLALASKWVALYGIGALGLIWLARSAWGRALAVVGLIGIGALLLPSALSVPADGGRLPNLPFLAVVTLVTAVAVVVTRRARDDSRALFDLQRVSDAVASGASALLVGATLIALPLAVYLISYLPWAALGNQIVEGWPPGNDGRTLADLTTSMYQYHDTLRVAHAASSPWWAWPFDLKPVWFFQESFAAIGGWSGAIYNGGNVASRVLGLAAGAWLVRQAWTQKSWGLASIAVLFFALWLPWARVDRAAFQYHYFPSSQIALIALALLLADLRNGATRAVRMAQLGFAALILAAPLLWATTPLLCAAAGVLDVYPESHVCLSSGLATPGPVVGALLLIPAGYAAWSLRHISDPRRLFRWLIATIGLVALIWYPNWSALPLPTGVHNAYQGLLPTWTWSFQFGVTLEKPVDVPLVSGATLLFAAALAAVALFTYALLEYARRRELHEDRAKRNSIGR